MSESQSALSESELTSDQMYDAASKLKEAGDLAGAVEALLKIIDVDKDHLHTNMALGVFMQKLDRIEEAIKYAVRVTEIQPEDPFSFTQLSVIYQRCGKIPEAEFVHSAVCDLSALWKDSGSRRRDG